MVRPDPSSPVGGTPSARNISKSSQKPKVTQQLKPPGLAQMSARLVVVSGRDLHHEYGITLKDFQGNPVRNTIGSGPDCQVVVSGDPSVSQRHCEIHMEEGHLCLFNLAPTNATIICRGVGNRIEVSGKQFLRNGDRIWVGSTELQLLVSEFSEGDLGR